MAKDQWSGVGSVVLYLKLWHLIVIEIADRVEDSDPGLLLEARLALLAELANQDLVTAVTVALLKCTGQLVTIVEKNVKFLSGQPAANLFFAAIVLKAKGVVLIQEGLKDLKTGQCLMLPVLTVGKTVKFRFGPAVINRYFAATVLGEKRMPYNLNIMNSLKP